MAFIYIALYLSNSSAQYFPLWKQIIEFSVATEAHFINTQKLNPFYQTNLEAIQIHYFALISSDEEMDRRDHTVIARIHTLSWKLAVCYYFWVCFQFC